MGDASWKTRAIFASDEVVATLARRIREHIDHHQLPFAHLELHGGEPLLYGKSRFKKLLDVMRAVVGPERIKFSVQTNGLLLDEEWVDLLTDFGVHVGISIDGPPSPLSQRIDKNGRDTTPDVVDVLGGLRSVRPNFRPGALAVLSDSSDICRLIDWFPSIGIRSFDLLFPLGNAVTQPIGISNLAILTERIVKGFEYWQHLGTRAPRIRLYELMIEGFLGHEIILDALGGDLTALCVVESNGAIGMNDVTRFLGGRYASDDLNISTHALDAHAGHFDIESAQRLCAKCQNCEVANACGGGYLPDRFDGTTFSNPTYYCAVMFGLGQRILRYLEDSVPADAWTTGLNRVH